MRLVNGSTLAVVVAMVFAAMANAQAPSETSRAVQGGGISVPGWTGKIDANEEKAGQS